LKRQKRQTDFCGQVRCGIRRLGKIMATFNAAKRRHAEHYQSILATANDLYLQGGEKINRGLALFDAERMNIEAGQAWASENAEDNNEAASLCISYADNSNHVLDLRQRPSEWIRWLEAMLGATRKLNRRDAEVGRSSDLQPQGEYQWLPSRPLCNATHGIIGECWQLQTTYTLVEGMG
jgi:hypothetical protein